MHVSWYWNWVDAASGRMPRDSDNNCIFNSRIADNVKVQMQTNSLKLKWNIANSYDKDNANSAIFSYAWLLSLNLSMAKLMRFPNLRSRCSRLKRILIWLVRHHRDKTSNESPGKPPSRQPQGSIYKGPNEIFMFPHALFAQYQEYFGWYYQ